MIKALKISAFCLLLIIFQGGIIQADGEDVYDLTQGDFAIQLVNVLKLQSYLPQAPLENDYIDLLELFGISPLKGWERKKMLTEEDYIVIMARLSGQERQVYQAGLEFCEKVVMIINEAWQKQILEDGSAENLEVLLQDQRYFEGSIPSCPFGYQYHAATDGLKVRKHVHLQAWLTSLRFDK
ncbi:MAG: hypothetical protein Q8Q33_03820 [Chlamydiota bacterium]|nr:hypothetical protein [Chlamydiota bacterium]